jgi:hypothetical protein
MSRAHRAVAPDAPSHDDVVAAVRSALYDPDPLARAEAAARLMRWGLPISARAVVVAAERAIAAQPA